MIGRHTPVIILMFIGAGLVLYFSWVPSPRLTLVGYLPDWVDNPQNENSRTAVPLLLLGLLAGSGLCLTSCKWAVWLLVWIGLIGIVLIAELGQLLLPQRSFDWGDVGWGALGALSGLILPAMLAVGYKILQLNTSKVKKPHLKKTE